MPTAIQVKNLHKHYKSVHALRGVSLTIGQGEFFGLLGPNGAGKSTLINIIAGLTRKHSGEVSVMGHDVVSDYRAARRCLGVVPQELVYDPFFTVHEILKIQAGYFGKRGPETDAWIQRLLEGLQLVDKAGVNIRALSGGMKRRVLIAQALVHKPPVVILDEPTAGVDVELRSSLWRFIEQLHREGHTIVLTTHYLEEAEALCQRIGIIHHGQLIALDSKEALMAGGAGRRRRLHVSLAAPLATLPAALQDKITLHDGQRLEITLEHREDSIISVVDSLRDAGADIVDLQTEDADLEDVFIELTRRAS